MDTQTEFICKTMINQPIINIGMIGHVANGKSTLTADITGTATQKHKDEQSRNITIHLGYANAKIWKCLKCDAPSCYQSSDSSTFNYNCKKCKSSCKLMTHISFTDVPGHDLLISTMMNGTCVMDYTILVESISNDNFPAPQTIEHLNITKKNNIEPKLVCLNKIDLLLNDKPRAQTYIDNIRNYMSKEQNISNIPIIPISGSHKCNVDVVCEYIASLAIPKKNIDDDFKMYIVRSFNINKPGTHIKDLKGGVVGGCLQKGIIYLNDDIIISPGIVKKNNDKDPKSDWKYTPLIGKVISINTDKNELKYAIPGGLIAVQLNIDPGTSCGDRLVGQLMFKKDSSTMKIYEELKIKLIEYNEDEKVKKSDKLKINVNANNVECTITKTSSNHIYLKLDIPVCVEDCDKVTLSFSSKNTKKKSGIFGYGHIVQGIESIIAN